jgi:formiminoglutamase
VSPRDCGGNRTHMTTPFVWQGRTDAQEVGDSRRWHHVVRAFDDRARDGVALMGFAVDEGVRRNGGRVGAAQGPRALRSMLANMPVLTEPSLWDAGDVICEGDTLEAAQEALASRVATAIQQGCRPVVMGGGHEMAWGTFQGIVRALPRNDRLLIVNIDAHFDLRIAAHPNSGTPFRQMAEWCAAHGRRFDYHVLGISRFGNTRALFDRADALGVRFVADEALQDNVGLAAAREALDTDLANCDGVYLTICLDVLPAHVAPGVSAPASLGVPLHIVEGVVDQVLASGKLLATDLAELNPTFDLDNRTARAAARLVARIARGYSA